MSKRKKTPSNLIVDNRKSRHDYHLGDRFEAGLVLDGWEVKSIRANRVQLKDGYVHIRQGEAWLLNCHISPLTSAPVDANPTRPRKLLLNHKELCALIRGTEKKGFTVVPTNLHWSKQWVKLSLALGQGKKQYDKRHAQKEKDLKREAARSRDQ